MASSGIYIQRRHSHLRFYQRHQTGRFSFGLADHGTFLFQNALADKLRLPHTSTSINNASLIPVFGYQSLYGFFFCSLPMNFIIFVIYDFVIYDLQNDGFNAGPCPNKRFPIPTCILKLISPWTT